MHASSNIARGGLQADQAAFVAALDQAHARAFHSISPSMCCSMARADTLPSMRVTMAPCRRPCWTGWWTPYRASSTTNSD